MEYRQYWVELCKKEKHFSFLEKLTTFDSKGRVCHLQIVIFGIRNRETP